MSKCICAGVCVSSVGIMKLGLCMLHSVCVRGGRNLRPARGCRDKGWAMWRAGICCLRLLVYLRFLPAELLAPKVQPAASCLSPPFLHPPSLLSVALLLPLSLLITLILLLIPSPIYQNFHLFSRPHPLKASFRPALFDYFSACFPVTSPPQRQWVSLFFTVLLVCFW